jgi:hypothetical protein
MIEDTAFQGAKHQSVSTIMAELTRCGILQRDDNSLGVIAGIGQLRRQLASAR